MSDSSSSTKKERENTIFVGNLPYSYKEEDVKNIFQNIKTLGHIYLPLDQNHHMRGFGFVSFGTEEDAVKAMRLYDNSIHEGKPIRCRWGNECNPQNPESSQEFFAKERGRSGSKDHGKDRGRDRNSYRDKERDRRRSKSHSRGRDKKYKDDYSDYDQPSKRKHYKDSDDDSYDIDKGQNDDLDIESLMKAAKVKNEEQLVEKFIRSPSLMPIIHRQLLIPNVMPPFAFLPPGPIPQGQLPPGQITSAQIAPAQMAPGQIAPGQMPISQLPPSPLIPFAQNIIPPGQPQPAQPAPMPQPLQIPQQQPPQTQSLYQMQ